LQKCVFQFVSIKIVSLDIELFTRLYVGISKYIERLRIGSI